jgi:hypothetical protein
VEFEETCARNRVRVLLIQIQCFSRQATVPFYKVKGTIYNLWFTGMPTLFFRTKLTLQGFTGGLHRKAHMSEGAQRRACFVMAATCSHSSGGHVNPCSSINAWTDLDQEAGLLSGQ